jgi:tetratricopeptide (TPR) repeat protein
LEKDRNRRYETAKDFSADVQRYLNDEPVQACPPSAAYRFRKFARRNKTALVTASLIGVALIAATVISTWQAVRATRAENESTLKRAEAEASHKKARHAIEEYFTLVSESKLLNVPGLQPLRKQLLDSALRYYREMAEKRDTDPTALADVAVAFLRVSNVCHEMGRNDDALGALDAGLDAVERLRREHPQARAALLQVAGYYQGARPMSAHTAMPKDVPAAERTLNRFLTLWETLAAEHPDVEGFQSDLSHMNAVAGRLQGGIGARGDKAAFGRAVTLTSRAAAIAERLSQANPKVVRYAENYAVHQSELIWLLSEAGQATEAQAALDRALAAFQKLADQHPDVPVYREWLATTLVNVAHRFQRDGKKQQALVMGRRAFDILTDLAIRFPVIRSHSHQLLLSAQLLTTLAPESMPGVVATFNKIIEKHPDNSDLLAARGRWRLTVQQLQEGVTDLGRALELADDAAAPYWRMERANAFAALKQDQNALAELTRATQQWPAMWEAWVWRGNFFFHRRQWSNAIADYSRGLELNPNWSESWNNRGLAFASLKQWDKAVSDQTRAIELRPDVWYLWHHRGHAYVGLQQWDAVLADFTQQVTLDSSSAANVVKFLKDVGRPEEAERLMRHSLSVVEKQAYGSPDNPTHRRTLAELYATLATHLGKPQEAELGFTRALAKWPNDAHLRSNRGRAWLALGQPDKALADITRAIESAPDDGMAPWWYLDRARAYVALKQDEKALSELTFATEKWPKLWDTWVWRGDHYRDRRHWVQAIDDYSKALELNAAYGPAWHARAVAYVKLNKHELAVADLRQAFDKGYKDLEGVKKDELFAPLRDREDFKKLLAEVEGKKK